MKRTITIILILLFASCKVNNNVDCWKEQKISKSDSKQFMKLKKKYN